MSDTKFTPGPWRAIRSRSLNAYGIFDSHGIALADVWGDDIPVPDGAPIPQPKYNAKLMATAPEMYEALQNLREWLINEIDGGEECRGRDGRISEQIRIADAAILKAEGN